jgi:hypothetical protein
MQSGAKPDMAGKAEVYSRAGIVFWSNRFSMFPANF